MGLTTSAARPGVRTEHVSSLDQADPESSGMDPQGISYQAKHKQTKTQENGINLQALSRLGVGVELGGLLHFSILLASGK